MSWRASDPLVPQSFELELVVRPFPCLFRVCRSPTPLTLFPLERLEILCYFDRRVVREVRKHRNGHLESIAIIHQLRYRLPERISYVDS